MKGRVLLGLSGGVDSAVAGYLLLQAGYEVVAGFMKNYSNPTDPHCTTRADRDSALSVAEHLGISTFVICDFRTQYHDTILTSIYDGYQKGITPNPDVLCNTQIKFKLFLEQALSLGCDYVATGHYAQITHDTHYHLHRGIDNTKDQSYFLSGLSQYQLSKALFPLGGLTKTAVRSLASQIGLPNADRPDSQGLCFVGNIPMHMFLQDKLGTQPGPIHDGSGVTIGQHDGAYLYTIGQSKFINVGQKMYVTAIDISTNTLTVGHQDDPALYRTRITVSERHRIGGETPNLTFGLVQIRYRQAPQPATLEYEADTATMSIVFDLPQRGVAPGQVAVISIDQEIIGSGVIL